MNEDECNCICHTNPEHIKHCMPFCVRCSNCDRNIEIFSYTEHKEKCKDVMHKFISECREKRTQQLEKLALAFIDQTGLLPSEAELVEEHEGTKIVWYFRARKYD